MEPFLVFFREIVRVKKTYLKRLSHKKRRNMFEEALSTEWNNSLNLTHPKHSPHVDLKEESTENTLFSARWRVCLFLFGCARGVVFERSQRRCFLILRRLLFLPTAKVCFIPMFCTKLLNHIRSIMLLLASSSCSGRTQIEESTAYQPQKLDWITFAARIQTAGARSLGPQVQHETTHTHSDTAELIDP